VKQSATLKLIERSKAEWHFKTITIERSKAEWDRPSQSQSAADLVLISVRPSVTLIPTYVPVYLSPSHFHLELLTDRQNDSNVHGIVDGHNLLYIWYVRYFSYVEFFLTHGLLSVRYVHTYTYTEKKGIWTWDHHGKGYDLSAMLTQTHPEPNRVTHISYGHCVDTGERLVISFCSYNLQTNYYQMQRSGLTL
jgi:hypothetical protein